MGPTWVLSAPDGPYVGPMNLAIGVFNDSLPMPSPLIESTCGLVVSVSNHGRLISSYFHTLAHNLTHWGRVTHTCVSKLTIIGSDNGLSPGRRQAIIWTNAGILLIGPWRTNFSEILISIQTFSFKKMHLKMGSAKWRPLCLGLNVLTLDQASRHTEMEAIFTSDVFSKNQQLPREWLQ